MTTPSAKSDPARAQKLEGMKQEVWARTLAGIPTTVGRLVYLASLRDESTGRYRDPALAGDCSDAETHLILSEVHEEVFRTWLSFSLRDQHGDTKEFLQAVKEGNARTWLILDSYLKLIPASAEGAERELYRLDLEMLLELLRPDFT